MEESKDERKGFMLFMGWYEQMILSFRTNKQRAECLFALCDWAFYDKEYEGKNKLIKKAVENAKPAILEQRKNYENKKNKYKHNKKINNYKRTYEEEKQKREEEERIRILERIKNQNKLH